MLTRRRAWLAIALACLLLYGRTAGHALLLWDDPGHLTENPYLGRSGGIAYFWTHAYNYLYIPVAYTAWAALAGIASLVSGPSPSAWPPGIFHGANVLLHLLNSLLVFRLLEILLAPAEKTRKSPPPSFAPALGGALFFAVHPLQVEPVAWAAGLRDLLATAFALGAMIRWLRIPRAFSWRPYLGASGLFVLALLSKPSVVTVPLLLLTIDRLVVRRRAGWAMASLLPWLAADLGAILATKAEQTDAKLLYVVEPWLRPAVALDALAFYAAKIVAPVALSADYAWTAAARLAAPTIWPCALATLAGLVGLSAYRRRMPLAFAGALLVLAGFLPVLGFVPFEFQNFSTVADRFAYLPMVGLAFLFALLVRREPRSLAALVPLLGLSLLRVPAWKNDETLFADTLAKNPASHMAHNNLGLRLYHQGRLEEALAHYRAALRLSPRHAPAQDNVGVALAKLGRYPELIAHYREVLKARPTAATLHADLGAALIMTGQVDEGIAECRRALELDPKLQAAADNLAKTLRDRGQATR